MLLIRPLAKKLKCCTFSTSNESNNPNNEEQN